MSIYIDMFGNAGLFGSSIADSVPCSPVPVIGAPSNSEVPVIKPGDVGNWLFTDGGVISSNPSAIGGTWSWVRVCDGEELEFRHGVLLPVHTQTATVSNNNTEFIALCRGILALPDDWRGTVASDSLIALGWVFKGYDTTNIPASLRRRIPEVRAKAAKLDHILLAGHPSRKDLAAGRRLSKLPAYPVSIHNVRCDTLCNEAAEAHRQKLAGQEAIK